jgi:hypothetical protein
MLTGKSTDKVRVLALMAVLYAGFSMPFFTASARAGDPGSDCDSTNGPCDCPTDGSPGTQLPNQSSGVTGWASMSAKDSEFPNEDSCSAVGQCQDETDARGSAVLLSSENATSAVVGSTEPDPEGLDAALADLDWYRVNLCSPLTVAGATFQFQAGQEKDLGGAGPCQDRPGTCAYDWIDFFVVVTLASGERVIGYEQHGIVFGTDPGGSNSPIIGSDSCRNDQGLQTAGFHGNRTVFFEASHDAVAVTFYFDGSSCVFFPPPIFACEDTRTAAIFEPGSVTLLEPGAQEGVCDPSNGPCSCDGSQGETAAVLDRFPSPPQLPLQSGGVTGYAVATNFAPINDNEDSCGGVGQCLEQSTNNEPPVPPGDPDRGRTAMKNVLNGATAPVIGSEDPNPPGLDFALTQLNRYEVNLCDPLCITGLKQVVVTGHVREDFGGPYEWLVFIIVLTLTNGDRVVAYEQHGVTIDGEEKFNEPIIGGIERPDDEGVDGGREHFFSQSYEVSKVTMFFNATTGFCYVGGGTVQLTESPGPRIDVRQTNGDTSVDEDDETLVDSYFLKLGQPPAAGVDVEVELTFDFDQVDAFPDTLTFTGENWFLEQEVMVNAIDDSILEDDPHTLTISHEAFGNGSGFEGATVDVEVTILENDDTQGACCFLDGSCTFGTSGDCDALSGVYQGDGTNCDTAVCPITILGACCTAGNCDSVTLEDCEAGGGLYVGDGISCGGINCPEPPLPGACCTGGVCTDAVTQADCESGGGTFQGEESDCGSVTCGTPFRRGDHDGSGIVDITDPLNLLGFLFLGTTPPICEDASDGDNSGIADITDALNVLGFLFLGSFPLNETLPGPMTCGLDPTVVIDPDGEGGFPPQPATSLGCDMYPSASGTACP